MTARHSQRHLVTRRPAPRHFAPPPDAVPCAATPPRFVGARHAVPVCAASTAPSRYFVSVASKGLRIFVSRLFAIVTGRFVSVAFKGLKLTVGVRANEEASRHSLRGGTARPARVLRCAEYRCRGAIHCALSAQAAAEPASFTSHESRICRYESPRHES
jgi:hypothetical protein